MDVQPSTSSALVSPSKEGSPCVSILSTHFRLDESPLGCGAFGCVFKAEQIEFENSPVNIFHLIENKEEPGRIHLSLESTFALKLIPEGSLSEVTAMSRVCHPNIVACYNVWAENNCEETDKFLQLIRVKMNPLNDSCVNVMSSYSQELRDRTTMYRIPLLLVLQMEYCDAGTLGEWLISQPQATRKERCQIFSQIIEAFVYLQLKGLVHGDLKLDNVLFKKCTHTGTLLVKLGDFGLTLSESLKLVATQGNPSHELRPEPISKEEIIAAINNRRLFLPPERARLEAIKNSGEIVIGATHKMDVYSLGLVWLCLLSPPNTTIAVYFRIVRSAMLPTDERKLSNSLESNLEELHLIQKMIDWDTAVRPSATEVKEFIQTREDYRQQPEHSMDIDVVADFSQKRDEIEQSLQLYENVCECGDEDRPPILADVFRKKYQILLEIIVNVLRYIHPLDELFTRATECFDRFDNEGYTFESGDVLYWFGKLVQKCDSCLGPDAESAPILKIRATLASTKMFSDVEQEHVDSHKDLQKLMESSTFQNLQLLSPVRLMIQAIDWNSKYCQKFTSTVDHSELEFALKQAKEVYNGLLNEGIRPESDHKARGVLNVIVHILTQLGRADEAELKLQELILPVGEDCDADADSVPDYYTLVFIYSKFLEHFQRYQEAINLLDRMYQIQLRCGNKGNAISALDHLAGLAYQMEEEHKSKDSDTDSRSNNSGWAIEGEKMSLFQYYMMQAAWLKGDVQKSSDLLLNRNEFELGATYCRRSKSVDFLVLDKEGSGYGLPAMKTPLK